MVIIKITLNPVSSTYGAAKLRWKTGKNANIEKYDMTNVTYV